tara:strand:- start:2522 stop:4462 length:1941 start_codon:yes stop_codon:yes gene_type:complete
LIEINLNGNNIVINDLDNILETQDRIYLEIYNIKYNNDQDFYIGTYKESDYKNILEYLKNRDIPYTLSQNASDILNSVINDQSIFDKAFLQAKGFKVENSTNIDYEDFISFLIDITFKSDKHKQLKEHQLKSAYHISLVQNGAIFSVPGSGKTAVVLSIYEKLRLEGIVDTIFVVGPTSSFGPWRDEFKTTLDREPKYSQLNGGDYKLRELVYINNPSELYLTTFQTLTNDQGRIKDLFQYNAKVFFVIDEAHYIKKVKGTWANAVINVAKHSIRRCILTGTPIPRNYSDLYNLFEILWGDNSPFTYEVKERINALEKRNNLTEIFQLLHDLIGPLFYRVGKKDLKLAEQKNNIINIDMNPIESEIYKAINTFIINNPITEENSRSHDFNLLTISEINKRGRLIRLRQAASNPYLINTALSYMPKYNEDVLKGNELLKDKINNYNTLETPAKIIQLLKLIKKFQENDEKVVIWSNFLGTIKLIGEYLGLNECKYRTITGSTPLESEDNSATINDIETRESIRKLFLDQNSGVDILVANPAACSESISLHTTCHKAVYYDLSYNCAQYIQSMDRIHRVGGSENIPSNYYFLTYNGTIDNDIYTINEERKERMERIIDQDYRIYDLDMDDSDDQDEINSLYNLAFKNS